MNAFQATPAYPQTDALAEVLNSTPKVTIECLDVLQNHSDEVWDAEFSADGEMLASCSKDKRIVIWQLSHTNQVRTGECVIIAFKHKLYLKMRFFA